MRILFLLIAAVLVGCSHYLPQATTEWSQLQQQYKAAIADAAVIEKSEITPVAQLDQAVARFITWTNYPDSYNVSEPLVLSWGDTWATLDGAVQLHCREFPKDSLDLRIQQLLGLPPQEQSIDRFFVVLEVNTADIFRPCANGSLLASQCEASFPSDATESHKAWYASQSALAYQAPNGYPWTRLGYTYNWYAQSSEVGVFEFVIKKGAQVKVVDVMPTAKYCQ
jgi:hypothetical protein